MIGKSKLIALAITSIAITAAIHAASRDHEITTEIKHIPLNISSDLVSECDDLTIYHTTTKDIVDEVTAECATEHGVYRITEQNPRSDLIGDNMPLPSFYKGVEIMSDIGVAKLHIDTNDKVLMSFEVALNQARIRDMIDNGTFGDNIEPLLARMKLNTI